MKIPNKIQIIGRTIDVFYEKKLKELQGADGYVELAEGIIRIMPQKNSEYEKIHNSQHKHDNLQSVQDKNVIFIPLCHMFC